MRVNWNFPNEQSKSFNKKPAFSPKPNWKNPEGYPNLEMFLSQIEDKFLKL